MRHLKLISIAVLVVGRVFHVGAFPTVGNRTHATGYFGYAEGPVNSVAELVLQGFGKHGSGLHAGAVKVKNGLNDLFNQVKAEESLTWRVNPRSRAAALVSPGTSKSIADKINFDDILLEILLRQELPVTIKRIYDMAAVVLEKLIGLSPALKKTVDSFKTVFYVVKKIQEYWSGGTAIDVTTLMLEATGIYFMDVDPQFKQKLVDLTPMVYQAAFGDRDALRKIVSSLAERDTILQALNAMGFKTYVDLLKLVIGQQSSS